MPTKSTMVHLQEHLLAQIEELRDESLSDEALARATERGKAISGLAGRAIENARLALEVDKHRREYGDVNSQEAIAGFLPGKSGNGDSH